MGSLLKVFQHMPSRQLADQGAFVGSQLQRMLGKQKQVQVVTCSST